MINFKPYKSKFEYDVAKLMEEQGLEFEYEPKQIKYILPIRSGCCSDCGGYSVGKRSIYTPDFFIPMLGLWVETKGKWDSQGRSKIASVLDSENEITHKNFRMLFMYDNWITKNKREKYTDWSNKRNIISGVGTALPKEWLK